MPLRKAMREGAFRLARHDLAEFLKDHEEDILEVFREEMEALDEQIPEESMFIDIKMVPLGEAIMKAALHGISRFLSDESLSEGKRVKIEARAEGEAPDLDLKNSKI
ncbi:MAG: hypothetical protein JXC32_01495 [Anaerolineae bacterium]|nr:hypothetical protein [Anaerolineae bacterium]